MFITALPCANLQHIFPADYFLTSNGSVLDDNDYISATGSFLVVRAHLPLLGGKGGKCGHDLAVGYLLYSELWCYIEHNGRGGGRVHDFSKGTYWLLKILSCRKNS